MSKNRDKVSLSQYQSLLNGYLLPRWRASLLLLVVLLLGTGLELLSPFILAKFIDGALAGEALRQLFTLAILFLGLASLIQLGAVAESYLAADIGLKATNDMRADLARHCLKLDMSFHTQRSPGELIERVDGDVGRLSNFFSRFVVDLFGNGLLLIGVLFALFAIDWRVGLTLTVFTIITLVVIHSLRNVGVPYFRASSEAYAKLFGFLEERLSGAEDVRPNGGVPYVLRRFFEHGRSLFRKELKAYLIGMGMFSTSMILFSLGSVIALGLGAVLFQRELVTIGTVFMIFRYTELLTRPIEVIGRQVQDLQQAGASILRVQELLETKTRLADKGQAQTPAGALTVSFEDVSFHYPDVVAEEQGNVLNDLSFSLRSGRKLGLLGRTGSGKTTLSRLLFRFFDPVKGDIRVNGSALTDLSLSSLRQQIAMVTQDIQLFHASVRDNLTLFKKDIPDDRILQAIQDVGLWDWYQTLDTGLDSLLEPSGTGLSAGQAQLLAFVRVFLKDPGLVILDEASSRLDPATQAQLEQAVDKLLDGRTAIIIAHRMKTVERVDDIMILDKGHCIEQGERETLTHSDSHFAELLKTGLDEALA